MVQCREVRFCCALLQKSLADGYVLPVEFLRIWLAVQFVLAKSLLLAVSVQSCVYRERTTVCV
jgi:hypothetical protein